MGSLLVSVVARRLAGRARADRRGGAPRRRQSLRVISLPEARGRLPNCARKIVTPPLSFRPSYQLDADQYVSVASLHDLVGSSTPSWRIPEPHRAHNAASSGHDMAVSNILGKPRATGRTAPARCGRWPVAPAHAKPLPARFPVPPCISPSARHAASPNLPPASVSGARTPLASPDDREGSRCGSAFRRRVPHCAARAR